uniref:DNA polymerase III subunit epsilon n=1 Tax=Magnetococcus massalia (strain MO-1) TaxID=451514 RepID=A0A1S7LKF7_MAGMO
MERLIILDTETTGFDPQDGDRIIEIGCIELIDMEIGREFQVYLNPEREIPEEATKVHGISNKQVADCPTFREVYEEFLAFIGDAPLVIHYAEFDLSFLNAELTRVQSNHALEMERTIDTVQMARRLYPGSKASLNHLCERFGIDRTGRVFHGALLDAHLLVDVYTALCRVEDCVEQDIAPIIEVGDSILMKP